jgi:hypothetical protein
MFSLCFERARERIRFPPGRMAWHDRPMSEADPILTPRQLGFFSEWFVEVVWPSGRKERVDGFSSEAHARGWIAHESAAWIDEVRRPRR